MLHLALNGSAGHVKVRDLARALGVPQAYLAKILQELAAIDLVETRRGPAGGVRLAVAPEGISINMLVEALDGESPLDHCLVGTPGCTTGTPCAFHAGWVEVKSVFDARIGSLDLAALAARESRPPENIPTSKS
jgi:Rrf2 family iron-sulfur cluster assembly transcriptional regulator